MKSPELGYKAQRKVDYTKYYAIIMKRNYFRKLSPKIMSEYYQLAHLAGDGSLKKKKVQRVLSIQA